MDRTAAPSAALSLHCTDSHRHASSTLTCRPVHWTLQSHVSLSFRRDFPTNLTSVLPAPPCPPTAPYVVSTPNEIGPPGHHSDGSLYHVHTGDTTVLDLKRLYFTTVSTRHLHQYTLHFCTYRQRHVRTPQLPPTASAHAPCTSTPCAFAPTANVTCAPRSCCQPRPGTGIPMPAPPDQRACLPAATDTESPVAASLRDGRAPATPTPTLSSEFFLQSDRARPPTCAMRCPATPPTAARPTASRPSRRRRRPHARSVSLHSRLGLPSDIRARLPALATAYALHRPRYGARRRPPTTARPTAAPAVQHAADLL
mmetsp:Transcript_105637/g.305295  ORF Transcript_105637/g.305295 Transcript_105637/m.305295 type:complete len:312 (-) Transcript_105637:360-1295(-)